MLPVSPIQQQNQQGPYLKEPPPSSINHEQRNIYSKQPRHKHAMFNEYLVSHRQPTYNKTIEYFKGNEHGREKSTQVLDHAIKLKKQAHQLRADLAAKEQMRDQVNSIVKARMRRSSLNDDDAKSQGSQESKISDSELMCIRNIELMTDANIELK